MGGGNIDPFYNTMHSSGSEASSTVASPTLHTSNEGQTSPSDANIEPKYPSVAFTTRAPNGAETKITMSMEKPGVCGATSSTKLSLDIPRIDVSRIIIGPKDHAFVLYAVDGRQTTLSVSGNVTYDIQLLDSECSATKGEETANSTATLSNTVHQENDATSVPPQATSPAPSHGTSVRDAAELLQSLRSLLATPHVRAPRARNQFPMFNDDVESGQPPDGDGPFIFSQDEHPASRTQSLRRRDSHTLLRRPSQEFLTVPSPEIGLFATPPDAGRGRPADVRSALRSVLSISRTGSMNSERNMSRDRQEHWGIPGSQERVVTFEHEQHASSPEAEQRFSPVRERNHIHGRHKRESRRLPTPPPAPWFSREIQPPSPSASPIVDSPAAPSIRLQAPTPLMGGQRPLAGGQPPLANGLMPTVGGLMPLGEGERNGTPYPPGFVPSPNAAWAGYIKRTTQHNAPATQHVPTVVQHNVAAAQRNLTAELNPSATGNNFFAGLYARGANQAQNQPSQTQLLAPTTIGTQYGFSAPYSNWTPYTGALGQGTPLTPLGITPNFSSVSPGYPLPPMTMSSLPSMPLSSMPTLLPMATGASVNTPWYTPASCSLLAPPTGGLASSLSTSNPSPNVHGPSNGVYSYSSPNTLAPPSNVYGTSSSNVYGGASSNSYGPPSPNASHTHTAYVSSSNAGPTASAHSAPAHLCHAPWLAPQSLAATPTRLAVPSATYASDSTTLHSPTERRLAPTSSHRAPPITPFAAFTSPYSIAMPDQPEPVIPERPSFEPQTPFRSFTPTSSRSPSPTRIAMTPFPMMAPPLSPSSEPVEDRDDYNSSGWASSWVDPHAGWGEGDAYAGWDAWDLRAGAPSDDRQGRSTAAGATANNAQGSNSLYDALFGSPGRDQDPASGGHATTDKKVAFARISESDWYPQ